MGHFNLRLQEKDPEDIAEDFRDAIWGNSNDLAELTTVWAAGKSFISTLYWEDEITCLRPVLPEGIQRLECSLDNLAFYILRLEGHPVPF